MHRTRAERWAERHLTARRRQDDAEALRAERQRRGRRVVERYAPSPHRRAISGELVEDLAGAVVATVWRKP